MHSNYLGPEWVEAFEAPKPKKRTSLIKDELGILAFDPGGTTGWSHLRLPTELFGESIFDLRINVVLGIKKSWSHGQIDCIKDENLGCHTIKKLLETCINSVVVVEDFILFKKRDEKSRDLLSPVRITARIEEYLYSHGKSMFLQSPNMKTTANDTRMKAWKVHTSEGGLGHARDADRHMMLFLRDCYNKKHLRKKAWPHIYGE